MDVRLTVPNDLVVKASDLQAPGAPISLGALNVTLGGDLWANKVAYDRLRLYGTVNTVRGTYDFQGRRFTILRDGTVRFEGTDEIDPALDIRTERVIQAVTARVDVRGRLTKPEIVMTSVPPLEQGDILALIVFNRPVNELGTGERASLAETAGGIASGFLAAPLGESIGRALDLDLFEITTTNDEGDLGAGITLGQQIADKAFVKMRQQFGDRNVTEFLLEYQLADFLRAQTTAAPETSGSANRIGQRRVERAGVDLIFFFSY
jgi:translocation and assembly module TamB